MDSEPYGGDASEIGAKFVRANGKLCSSIQTCLTV